MSWMRSKVRQAALLALFALAVQLALSFGHFHGDGLVHASSLTAQAAASQQVSTLFSSSDPHPDGLADDYCAICASIELLDTLVAAVAPALPVPPTFAIRTETASTDFILPELPRAAFRSRAPPHS